MAYSSKVLDHYENPRNVGSFAKTEDPTQIGTLKFSIATFDLFYFSTI